MRQEPKREAGRGNKTTTPESIAKILAGLGAFTLRLDGCRVTAPAKLLARAKGIAAANWRITPWFESRLHLVPDPGWEPYLALVRRGFKDPMLAEDTVRKLEQASEIIALDSRNRWDIPADLLRLADLVNEKNSVVLAPNEFWLELVNPTTWERQLTETLRLAQQAYVPPSTSYSTR